ncbi:MAG: molybdopterin biosynthesis protein, partial [Desulfosalsimonas sp.]
MSSNRNIYLKMKTLRKARDLLSERFDLRPRSRGESVAVTEASGRILARPVYARLSSPGFHAAAMDGVAVKAENTFGATEASPKILETGTRAVFVNTGHIMPADTNAVIMIEDIQVIDDHRIQIEAPAFPWQHVRRMGEDIVATELLFARHHRITPYCIGALLAGGITEVSVLAKPRLFLLPTGPELVDHRQMPEELAPGRV